MKMEHDERRIGRIIQMVQEQEKRTTDVSHDGMK